MFPIAKVTGDSAHSHDNVLEGVGSDDDGPPKVVLDVVLGDPNVVFQVDALGRQYKVNLLIVRSVGKSGPTAKSGLAAKVPKPTMMDDWA